MNIKIGKDEFELVPHSYSDQQNSKSFMLRLVEPEASNNWRVRTIGPTPDGAATIKIGLLQATPAQLEGIRKAVEALMEYITKGEFSIKIYSAFDDAIEEARDLLRSDK